MVQGVIALLACLFVNDAVAQNLASFFGKPSLLEGGLIAEYHNSEIGSTNNLGVKHCGGSGGYCQYRDEPITDPETGATAPIDRDLKTTVGFNVTNTGSTIQRFFINRMGAGLQNVTVTGDTNSAPKDIGPGASDRLEITIVVDDNWSCCSQSTFTIQAKQAFGAAFGPSITVTVFDDDDKSYIGQRNGHPYDGYRWVRTPHCGAGASGSC